MALLFLAACAAPASEPLGHLAEMRLPSPDSLVREALARLFDTGTGELTETMTARAGSGTFTRTTTGRFDLDNQRASLTTEFSASSAAATVAVLGRAVALPTLAQQLVRDSSVLYLTKPSWTGAQRGRWIRYEGQLLGGLGRQWSDAVDPPWDPDVDLTDPAPTPLLALPQKMADAGRFLPGTAEVSRYQINVPLTEARGLVGGSALLSGTDAAGAAGADSGGATGPGEQLPVRVEVGRDGNLTGLRLDATRLVAQTVGNGAAASAGVRYDYELVLRRLGEPVDIAVPPAAAQSPGGLWVQDVRAGICLGADPKVRQQLYFPPVSCDAPHRYEVYGRVTLGTDADPYPGRRALLQQATAKCGAEFTRFVGVPPADSSLRFFTAAPAESVWLQGGHQAPCVLDAVAPVSGTLRGSDR